VTSQPLAIAQVSPFAWETSTEVGDHVAAVSHELAARGHQVLVIAPSRLSTVVKETRRALAGDPQELLARAHGKPLVLGVGEVLPFTPNRRRARAATIPVDVAKTIEEALQTLPLDIVHVHEPFAPSAPSAALRTSLALTVGTFHAPTERILSTQLARPLSQLLFSRLDARLASYETTRALMDTYFPGDYRVVMPSAEPLADTNTDPGRLEIALIATEERAAMRTLLRALRHLPDEVEWHATIWAQRPIAPPATIARKVRERVSFVDATMMTADEVLARASVAVLASEGQAPRPELLLKAVASGIVPVASGLSVYLELLSEGGVGLVFQPGDAVTLGAHLAHLARDPQFAQKLRDGAAAMRSTLSVGRVVDELEDVYAQLVARRHDLRPRNEVARRAVSEHELIDVDLHTHTDHSYDCATPVEVLLAEARERGLGAVAVTEHNEISGALEAAAKAEGIKVIVGEEVKTAAQGEVIGLFIKEKIPRGLTLQETIAEIKRQGGVVYVPHPFDRMHSVPDYKNLLEVIDDIDVIEVFNPRVAIPEFNHEAVRFAAKYRIIAGAGSDAHVPQGLGSVRIRMRDFNGPEEFLESLREADIIRNPASLFYVQALKFLQTKAMPEAARKASKERRVRRATRAD
jgi:glycosyltransferase involved in cell wall biosynthesis